MKKNVSDTRHNSTEKKAPVYNRVLRSTRGGCEKGIRGSINISCNRTRVRQPFANPSTWLGKGRGVWTLDQPAIRTVPQSASENVVFPFLLQCWLKVTAGTRETQLPGPRGSDQIPGHSGHTAIPLGSLVYSCSKVSPTPHLLPIHTLVARPVQWPHAKSLSTDLEVDQKRGLKPSRIPSCLEGICTVAQISRPLFPGVTIGLPILPHLLQVWHMIMRGGERFLPRGTWGSWDDVCCSLLRLPRNGSLGPLQIRSRGLTA